MPERRRPAMKVIVFPMAEGDTVAAAFADRRPAIEPGHFGVHPSFIEEDEAAWINVGLSCLPQLSPCRHVRSILLGGAQGFF